MLNILSVNKIIAFPVYLSLRSNKSTLSETRILIPWKIGKLIYFDDPIQGYQRMLIREYIRSSTMENPNWSYLLLSVKDVLILILFH